MKKILLTLALLPFLTLAISVNDSVDITSIVKDNECGITNVVVSGTGTYHNSSRHLFVGVNGGLDLHAHDEPVNWSISTSTILGTNIAEAKIWSNSSHTNLVASDSQEFVVDECSPPPPVDLCPEEGLQTELPCAEPPDDEDELPPPEEPIDFCGNIAGEQSSIPEGMTTTGSDCLFLNNGTPPPAVSGGGGNGQPICLRTGECPGFGLFGEFLNSVLDYSEGTPQWLKPGEGDCPSWFPWTGCLLYN